MNLEEKLRRLKQATTRPTDDSELERALQYLGRLEQSPKRLPAQRMPKGVEEYIDGKTEKNSWGEFFLARQAIPFGRPYGNLRIGDISLANLSPLSLFLGNPALPSPSELVFLDTETTGLAGGTGTCAFLIGIGAAEGTQFVIRQFFLRDYPEEKATLAALSEALESYRGLVTFNGKTFDIPLLETRYSLARFKSPFTRLMHLDLLHPARRMWKLRLESCELTRLEREILGIGREGDIPGSEIPGIYFDYLRTGNAEGLQPVFYHNALDIVTLAALAVELARVVREAAADRTTPSVDLFSLSRIFERAGHTQKSVTTCQRALAAGLPQAIESRALCQLATQYKRQRKYELAVELWLELSRREPPLAIEAFEELAIYYEHRRRDPQAALAFAEAAIDQLRENLSSPPHLARFSHRLDRLRRKSQRDPAPSKQSHSAG